MAESIAFDEAVADALILVLDATSDRLRHQGPERNEAAEMALADFAGGYARLFSQACAAEAEDRGLLAGRLADLSEWVRLARQRADEEKQRLQQLAQWQELRGRNTLFGLPSAPVSFLPSIFPIPVLMFSLAFSRQQRTRYAAAGYGGVVSAVSSANPTTCVPSLEGLECATS